MTGLETKISRNAVDIIQKYTSSLFRDATLEFYGIKTAKIKELINVELPVMEVGGSSADFVFLLEDDSYLHFEFQTTFDKDDLLRFAGYDLRLYARDGRRIVTVVIYTADVTRAETELDLGSMVYRPEKIMMADYDGNAIYERLSARITAGDALTDAEMLSLIFLPLMGTTLSRGELAENTIKLAQSIPDRTKRDACIAAAFAFGNRYLDENGMERIKEALQMSNFFVSEMERVVEKEAKKRAEKMAEKMAEQAVGLAVGQAVGQAVEQNMVEVARKLLKRGALVQVVAEDTGLDEGTVRRLKAEME